MEKHHPAESIKFERWTEARLSVERIKNHLAELTPSPEERAGRSYGIHVVNGDDSRADVARFVEWTVFEEFFNNDINLMRKEYSPYDDASTFLLALDYDNQKPMGVVRIIRPSPAGLKSMNDLVNPEGPWCRNGDTAEARYFEIGDNPDRTVDIGTMAVMPEYRSGHAENGTSAALYSSCVRWSLQNNYNQWITIVDKNIFEMMQSWGEPFKPFEGADWASYLDSPLSLPVHTELHSGLKRIQEFDKKMTEEHGQKFDIHGLYTKSKGLESSFVLPSFSSVVE